MMVEKTVFSDLINAHSVEERERYYKRHQSKEQALKYLTALFGDKVARVIVFNILVVDGKAQTFDEAWNKLNYTEVIEILFRAFNNLPCKTKDKGELERYLGEVSAWLTN